jgi:hypothetical protein
MVVLVNGAVDEVAAYAATVLMRSQRSVVSPQRLS